MATIKDIITIALQRSFLSEMRSYMSAFVQTYVGRLAAATRDGGYVRPEWWYTNGDDWTAAFQSALNTGSVIVLTAGKTYAFSGAALQTKHDTIIEGNGALIDQRNAVWLDIKHNCTVRNLTITDAYEGTNTGHYAVQTTASAADILMDGIAVRSSTDHAFQAFFLILFSSTIVRRCTFSYAGAATTVRTCVTVLANEHKNCLVEDCTFTNETISSNIRCFSISNGNATGATLTARGCYLKGVQVGLLNGGSGNVEALHTIIFEKCTFDGCLHVQCWASTASGTQRRAANVTYSECTFAGDGLRTAVYLQPTAFNEYNVTLERCTGYLSQQLIGGASGDYEQDMRLTVSDCDLSVSRFSIFASAPNLLGRVVTTIERSRLTVRAANPYIYGTDIRLRDFEVVLGNTATGQRLLLRPAAGWGTVDIRNVTVGGKRWDDGHREGNTWRRYRDAAPVDLRPIVHRAIPLGAKVGSRYFFPDGYVHLRFNSDRLQQYMTDRGVTTVHYDFSDGWYLEEDKSRGVFTNKGSVATASVGAGIASLFGRTHVALRHEFGSLSPSWYPGGRKAGNEHGIIVTVRRSLMDAMVTGDYTSTAEHTVMGCLEVSYAGELTSETQSPDFFIRRGITECTAPYLQRDDEYILDHHRSKDEKDAYMTRRMVVYNSRAGSRKEVHIHAFRRACGYKGTYPHGRPVSLREYVRMARKNGAAPSKIRYVFRAHRLKHRHSRFYESTACRYYYTSGKGGAVKVYHITRRM